jgi:3-methyladenine DNA glycosylase AlkD
LLPIQREASDERNFVSKAVNWALRQIGERNMGLRREVIKAAMKIRETDSKIERWRATDALGELESYQSR